MSLRKALLFLIFIIIIEALYNQINMATRAVAEARVDEVEETEDKTSREIKDPLSKVNTMRAHIGRVIKVAFHFPGAGAYLRRKVNAFLPGFEQELSKEGLEGHIDLLMQSVWDEVAAVDSPKEIDLEEIVLKWGENIEKKLSEEQKEMALKLIKDVVAELQDLGIGEWLFKLFRDKLIARSEGVGLTREEIGEFLAPLWPERKTLMGDKNKKQKKTRSKGSVLRFWR